MPTTVSCSFYPSGDDSSEGVVEVRARNSAGVLEGPVVTYSWNRVPSADPSIPGRLRLTKDNPAISLGSIAITKDIVLDPWNPAADTFDLPHDKLTDEEVVASKAAEVAVTKFHFKLWRNGIVKAYTVAADGRTETEYRQANFMWEENPDNNTQVVIKQRTPAIPIHPAPFSVNEHFDPLHTYEVDYSQAGLRQLSRDNGEFPKPVNFNKQQIKLRYYDGWVEVITSDGNAIRFRWNENPRVRLDPRYNQIQIGTVINDDELRRLSDIPPRSSAPFFPSSAIDITNDQLTQIKRGGWPLNLSPGTIYSGEFKRLHEQRQRETVINLRFKVWGDGKIKVYEVIGNTEVLLSGVNELSFDPNSVSAQLVIKSSRSLLIAEDQDTLLAPFSTINYQIRRGVITDLLSGTTPSLTIERPLDFDASLTDRKNEIKPHTMELAYFADCVVVRLDNNARDLHTFKWNVGTSGFFTRNEFIHIDKPVGSETSLDNSRDPFIPVNSVRINEQQYQKILRNEWPTELNDRPYAGDFKLRHKNRKDEINPPSVQLVPKEAATISSSSRLARVSSDSDPSDPRATLLGPATVPANIKCKFYADRVDIIELPEADDGSGTYSYKLNFVTGFFSDEVIIGNRFNRARENLNPDPIHDPFFTSELVFTPAQLSVLQNRQLKFEPIVYSDDFERAHKKRLIEIAGLGLVLPMRPLPKATTTSGSLGSGSAGTIATGLSSAAAGAASSSSGAASSSALAPASSLSSAPAVGVSPAVLPGDAVYDASLASHAVTLSATRSPVPAATTASAPAASVDPQFADLEIDKIVQWVENYMQIVHHDNSEVKALVQHGHNPEKTVLEITLPETFTKVGDRLEITNKKPDIEYSEHHNRTYAKEKMVRGEVKIIVTKKQVSCQDQIDKNAFHGMAAAFFEVYMQQKQIPPINMTINPTKFPPDLNKLASREAWEKSIDTMQQRFKEILLEVYQEKIRANYMMGFPPLPPLSEDDIRIKFSPTAAEIFSRPLPPRPVGTGLSAAPLTSSPVASPLPASSPPSAAIPATVTAAATTSSTAVSPTGALPPPPPSPLAAKPAATTSTGGALPTGTADPRDRLDVLLAESLRRSPLPANPAAAKSSSTSTSSSPPSPTSVVSPPLPPATTPPPAASSSSSSPTAVGRGRSGSGSKAEAGDDRPPASPPPVKRS